MWPIPFTCRNLYSKRETIKCSERIDEVIEQRDDYYVVVVERVGRQLLNIIVGALSLCLCILKGNSFLTSLLMSLWEHQHIKSSTTWHHSINYGACEFWILTPLYKISYVQILILLNKQLLFVQLRWKSIGTPLHSSPDALKGFSRREELLSHAFIFSSLLRPTQELKFTPSG